MLSPFLGDLLAAGALLSGVVLAGVVARRHVRRRMTAEDWGDAASLDGARRARFLRAHGLRLLVLLAAILIWFALVGTLVLPLIEAVTDRSGQAAEAAQSQ